MAASAIHASGVEARVGYTPGAGHRSWGPILDVLQDEIDWLLEGDRRFGAR